MASNISNNTLNNTTGAAWTSYWAREFHLLVSIDYLIIVVAVILHVLGIALLLKNKPKELSNQSVLLIHLSFTSILSLFTNSCAIYYKVNKVFFPKLFIIVFYIGHMSYISTLVLLSLDRLVFVFLTVKYRSYVTSVTLTVSLIIAWLISIAYGITLKYGDLINHMVYAKYSSFFYNGFVIAFTIIAYVCIVIKVKRTSLENSTNEKRKKSSLKKYLVPFLLVSTFFIFAVVPAIILLYVTVPRRDVNMLVIGLIGINVLNHISDPLIYVFLQPSVRKMLSEVLLKMKLFLCYYVQTKDGEARFKIRKRCTPNSSENRSSHCI